MASRSPKTRELQQNLQRSLAERDVILKGTLVGISFSVNRRHLWVNETFARGRMQRAKHQFRMLCSAALLVASGLAAAQSFPARPIRIVVPYTPGGFTDVTTRIVAGELSKNVGQNVIIDNRPGANSIVGVDLVAQAAPDGYMLVSVIPAHAANQTLYP